ncbi:MAG: DUF5320 domain-containing protein [Candidatus Micrarchaeia archaeon]
MPYMDGKGPLGLGPATGRGMGRCIRNEGDTTKNVGRGFGRSLGRGLGRGFRHRILYERSDNLVKLTTEEKIKFLESELKMLELRKQEIEKKINELKQNLKE